MECATDKPRVWVLSTGGTIAGKGASTMSLSEYRAGTLLGSQLVDAVPEFHQYARVEVEQIANIGSPDIMLDDWLKLASRINAILGRSRAPPAWW